jgi:hypothetical protein
MGEENGGSSSAELVLASLTEEERALLAEPSPPGKRTKEWWDAHPREREKAGLRLRIARAQGRFAAAPKRRPAYEAAAAQAAINGERISKELVNQALHAESIPQRQKAIEILFGAERQVRQERRDEEDHWARLEGDALTAELMKLLRERTGSDEFIWEGTAEEEGVVSDEEIVDAQEVS